MNVKKELFLSFLNYHWLRPEVALIKYFQAMQWRQWRFIEPSLDLMCGDGEFSFITWGGEFDISADMYMNVPSLTVEDYFSNRDVYNIPFKKKVYKIKKKADISISTGFDYSKGQQKKAEKLNLYKSFITGDINNSLKMITSDSYKSIFTNSLNVAKKPDELLLELFRILQKDGRVFLIIQDKLQVENSFYNTIYLNKKLKIGKYLDRGIYDNLVDSTYDLKNISNIIKKCGFKIEHCEGFGADIIFKLYQIGFRPMFPALIEMYNSLSNNSFYNVKKKWVENIGFLVDELLDEQKIHLFNNPSKRKNYWYFLVLKRGHSYNFPKIC